MTVLDNFESFATHVERLHDMVYTGNMDPIEPVTNRRADGTFGPGNNANPNGKPKRQTMKEFAREVFANMTPEEKTEWLKGLSPEIVWRMSEGNPHNTQDMTSGDQRIGVAVGIIGDVSIYDAIRMKYEEELRASLLVADEKPHD